jgi:ABC-2 type transport system ATP-binding protein
LHDLELVCDHIILLSASRVLLCEDIEILLASHRLVVWPRRDLRDIEPNLTFVRARADTTPDAAARPHQRAVLDPAWEVMEVGLEELILGYMKSEFEPSHTRLGLLEVVS